MQLKLYQKHNKSKIKQIMIIFQKIGSETFITIFSNISQLANLLQNSTPTITIQNQNQRLQTLNPYNRNGINMNMNYDDPTKIKIFSI